MALKSLASLLAVGGLGEAKKKETKIRMVY